jgi:hypothetical protein
LYNQSATFAITGIDDEAAEKILSKFYLGDDAEGTIGEASPLKVRRRTPLLEVTVSNVSILTVYSASASFDPTRRRF